MSSGSQHRLRPQRDNNANSSTAAETSVEAQSSGPAHQGAAPSVATTAPAPSGLATAAAPSGVATAAAPSGVTTTTTTSHQPAVPHAQPRTGHYAAHPQAGNQFHTQSTLGQHAPAAAHQQQHGYPAQPQPHALGHPQPVPPNPSAANPAHLLQPLQGPHAPNPVFGIPPTQPYAAYQQAPSPPGLFAHLPTMAPPGLAAPAPYAAARGAPPPVERVPTGQRTKAFNYDALGWNDPVSPRPRCPRCMPNDPVHTDICPYRH